MSPSQYHDFRHNLDLLVKADKKTDLFEWTLLRIVDHHLGNPKPVRAKYYGVQQLKKECQTLLSCLAWVGQKDPAKARQAFDAGIKTLGFTSSHFIDQEQISLTEVGQAMDTLNALATPKKKKLLESCAVTIVDDQEVTYREAEMIRAISESLGCPMPPLLPGQKLI